MLNKFPILVLKSNRKYLLLHATVINIENLLTIYCLSKIFCKFKSNVLMGIMTKHVIFSIFSGKYMYKSNVQIYCEASTHLGFNILAFKIFNYRKFDIS